MSVQPRTAQVVGVALADLAAANDLLTTISGNPAFATVTAAAALIAGDRYIVVTNAASATYVLTLPLAASVGAGYVFYIKKTDAVGTTNTVTVTPAGSDKIDGASTRVLSSQYDYIHIVSDGVSNWLIMGAVVAGSLVA